MALNPPFARRVRGWLKGFILSKKHRLETLIKTVLDSNLPLTPPKSGIIDVFINILNLRKVEIKDHVIHAFKMSFWTLVIAYF